MRNFTPTGNRAVEEQIRRYVFTVADFLRQNLPQEASLYLAGSFGRGEGSVYVKDGKIRPLKDFDFVIISKKTKRSTLAGLSRSVDTLLALDELRNEQFRFAGFVIDLEMMSPFLLRNYVDLSIVDFRANSILLFGQDQRSQVSWEASDIPYTSCFRYLMEKHVGLIHLFTKVGGPRSDLDAVNASYECYKTYVELGSCITYMLRSYSPSYSERYEWLRSRDNANTIEQLGIGKELLDRILESHVKKLSSAFVPLLDLPDKWRQTANDLLRFLDVYLRSATTFRAYQIPPMPSDLEKWLAHNYFRDILRPTFDVRVGKTLGGILAKMATPPFVAWMRRRYRLPSARRRPKLRLPAILHVYAVAPILLDGLCRGNSEATKEAEKYLADLNLDVMSGNGGERELVNRFLQLYSGYWGMK